MKLHLGCGQRYLPGYCNIDYPLAEHSVQKESVADYHSDIFDLSYQAGTIDEVRLHHVFEHFPRPIACAFLAGWFTWLKPGGILHIEVPDFQKTARVILSPFASFRRKAVAERHLFGSHEAQWAVHCEGYTPSTLRKMLESFGFMVVNSHRHTWRGTYNFEMVASRVDLPLSGGDLAVAASHYLGYHLLDGTEEGLLKVWMEDYRRQFEKCVSRNV